jgi:Alginate export
MKAFLLAATVCAASIALAHPALAAPGDPVKIGDGVTLDPIIDSRLRYESVDTPTLEADALTLRMRAGAELKFASGLSFLAEGEGTLALSEDYNAFPFAITNSQRRPTFAVVADPMNVELNRLQVQYKSKAVTLTVGRQRMNLDDQRFVGTVGWRQNEQTFDAARAEAKLGPISLDGTYAISQRTIFGVDAGPRQSYDGNFIFLGAGAKLGPVQAKAFAYLLDYDETFFLANSSSTYGVRLTSSLPLGGKTKLNLAASYARQKDYKANPLNYSADYIAAEGVLAAGDLSLTAGYELLGSGGTRGFQTPMATLHKFNGWADVFLTTPNGGLQDLYGGVAYKFGGVKALPGLNAAVTFHQFDSDAGSVNFGNEWDASLGFKLGRVNLLAKYADFNAKAPGFADKRIFWLQLEMAY